MNNIKMTDIITWWSLKSMLPYSTKEQKQHWQDKLDKVAKLVEELDVEDILNNTEIT
jgi:hypothetical protein